MVTIKSFAQLLTHRYQNENFRARFQDVVDYDIERMDDLLGLMIEFSDFPQPRWRKVVSLDKLSSGLNEIIDDCTRRQPISRGKGTVIVMKSKLTRRSSNTFSKTCFWPYCRRIKCEARSRSMSRNKAMLRSHIFVK